MEAVNGLARSVEANLGVSPNLAQVVVWMLILVVVYLALQLLQGFFSGTGSKVRRARGQSVFLLGQCGAGKTAVFFQLRDQTEVQSVSSLKPVRDTFTIKTEQEGEGLGPVDVVDYPGHQRLRGKLLDIIGEARCIVYVVDSEAKQQLKDVAEHLYELFTNQEVIDLRIPVLLACNKVDLPAARTEKFILEEIEREIEQMRVSRAATLEGQDQADSYLGIDGEKFRLLEHSPCSVEMCRISAKKNQLEPLLDFLRQQLK